MPVATKPQHVRNDQVEDWPVEQNIVRGQVQRGVEPESLQHGISAKGKIRIAIVESNRHSLLRKGPGTKPDDRLLERQDVIPAVGKHSHSGLEQLERDVESGVPQVLVAKRNSVITKHQQPLGPPS